MIFLKILKIISGFLEKLCPTFYRFSISLGFKKISLEVKVTKWSILVHGAIVREALDLRKMTATRIKERTEIRTDERTEIAIVTGIAIENERKETAVTEAVGGIVTAIATVNAIEEDVTERARVEVAARRHTNVRPRGPNVIEARVKARQIKPLLSRCRWIKHFFVYFGVSIFYLTDGNLSLDELPQFRARTCSTAVHISNR